MGKKVRLQTDLNALFQFSAFGPTLCLRGTANKKKGGLTFHLIATWFQTSALTCFTNLDRPTVFVLFRTVEAFYIVEEEEEATFGCSLIHKGSTQQVALRDLVDYYALCFS